MLSHITAHVITHCAKCSWLRVLPGYVLFHNYVSVAVVELPCPGVRTSLTLALWFPREQLLTATTSSESFFSPNVRLSLSLSPSLITHLTHTYLHAHSLSQTLTHTYSLICTRTTHTVINACNASLRSAKFSKMAVRTRKQYLTDLAECTTSITLEQASTGRVGRSICNIVVHVNVLIRWSAHYIQCNKLGNNHYYM